MKYKLINIQTKEEHLCDKVTIDGFDYYVSDELPKLNDAVITAVGNIHYIKDDYKEFIEYVSKLGKKIIACTNPNIDIPKVVDEVKNLAKHLDKSKFRNFKREHTLKEMYEGVEDGFIAGYNKSQETYPFSAEDMIDFYEWCDTSEQASIFWRRNKVDPDMSGNYWKKIRENREKLLQLWKEQKPKIVYYNE